MDFASPFVFAPVDSKLLIKKLNMARWPPEGALALRTISPAAQFVVRISLEALSLPSVSIKKEYKIFGRRGGGFVIEHNARNPVLMSIANKKVTITAH
ncbi:hypothetical protein [Pyramidobacter sp.]|uniref:hypothetical protein n=1 Tax=Pyramidobacter sp. TaxID=1943581 RepID=UPI0033243B02